MITKVFTGSDFAYIIRSRSLKRYRCCEMLNGNKIVVVMPAYNAARTLRRTYDEVMAQGVVDLVIVVDDASRMQPSRGLWRARWRARLGPMPSRRW